MTWRRLAFLAVLVLVLGVPSVMADGRVEVVRAFEAVNAPWAEAGLEVWLEKDALRKFPADRDRNRVSVGEWRHILLHAEKELYLIAVQVDSDGATTVLLPTAQGPYRMQARDRNVLFATPATPRGEVAPPMGPQDVFVYGSSAPVTLADLGVSSPFLSPDEAVALAGGLGAVLRSEGQQASLASARLQLAIAGRDTRGIGPDYTAQDIVAFFTHEATRAYRKMPAPIHFELNESRLTGKAQLQLDEFVIALTTPALAAQALVLEGHTDTSGEEGFNMELSKRRAEAAMNYLIDHGIEVRRLQMQAMGERQPMYRDETSEWHMQQNRRVEFGKPENPR